MDENRLRFLNASQVETPVGNLSDTVIIDRADRTLGKLDGIVIDPIEREVRYFVIRSRRWLRVHRYLLAAAPLRVDAKRHTLRILDKCRDLAQLPEVTHETLSPYSDEDSLDASYPHHAA